MLRVFAAVLLIVSLAACKSRPPTAEPPPPVIRSIAVIPASNPAWFSFENAMMPLVIPAEPVYWGANKIDNHSKARRFHDALNPEATKLGDEFTEQVVAKLRDHGFQVEILDKVDRTASDPDNVDYERIKTKADAILHIRLSEVGIYSGHWSKSYLPRVNASGKLWANGREESLYEEDLYYGVDAKKGKSWGIVPDPKYSYSSFDEVMSHITDIHESFDTGVKLVAERMSGQIIDSVRPYESIARGAP
ncbi:MAG TPA: hypothetical protein VGI93_01905 [Steroidobacteraceae bacterium]|jgi:hypothetical protein